MKIYIFYNVNNFFVILRTKLCLNTDIDKAKQYNKTIKKNFIYKCTIIKRNLQKQKYVIQHVEIWKYITEKFTVYRINNYNCNTIIMPNL